MSVNNLRTITLLMVLVFASVGIVSTQTTEPTTKEYPFVQTEVVKRDARDRVEIMEARTTEGRCIAQITYDRGPRIYIVVMSWEMLENIGHVRIDMPEATLNNAFLMRIFRDAIKEHCLPHIVPGYAKA